MICENATVAKPAPATDRLTPEQRIMLCSLRITGYLGGNRVKRGRHICVDLYPVGDRYQFRYYTRPGWSLRISYYADVASKWIRTAALSVLLLPIAVASVVLSRWLHGAPQRS